MLRGDRTGWYPTPKVNMTGMVLIWHARNDVSGAPRECSIQYTLWAGMIPGRCWSTSNGQWCYQKKKRFGKQDTVSDIGWYSFDWKIRWYEIMFMIAREKQHEVTGPPVEDTKMIQKNPTGITDNDTEQMIRVDRMMIWFQERDDTGAEWETRWCSMMTGNNSNMEVEDTLGDTRWYLTHAHQ